MFEILLIASLLALLQVSFLLGVLVASRNIKEGYLEKMWELEKNKRRTT